MTADRQSRWALAYREAVIGPSRKLVCIRSFFVGIYLPLPTGGVSPCLEGLQPVHGCRNLVHSQAYDELTGQGSDDEADTITWACEESTAWDSAAWDAKRRKP